MASARGCESDIDQNEISEPHRPPQARPRGARGRRLDRPRRIQRSRSNLLLERRVSDPCTSRSPAASASIRCRAAAAPHAAHLGWHALSRRALCTNARCAHGRVWKAGVTGQRTRMRIFTRPCSPMVACLSGVRMLPGSSRRAAHAQLQRCVVRCDVSERCGSGSGEGHEAPTDAHRSSSRALQLKRLRRVSFSLQDFVFCVWCFLISGRRRNRRRLAGASFVASGTAARVPRAPWPVAKLFNLVRALRAGVPRYWVRTLWCTGF